MGMFSFGGKSRSRTREAFAEQAASRARQKALLEEGTGQALDLLSPYDVGGEVVSQQMIEAGLRPGESKFQMTPMFQAIRDEKRADVAQQLANSNMMFTGAGISDLGEVGAQVTASAYDNYQNQLNTMMGLGERTTGQQGNLIMSKFGGLSDIEGASGQAAMMRANAMNALDSEKRAVAMKLAEKGIGAATAAFGGPAGAAGGAASGLGGGQLGTMMTSGGMGGMA